MDERLKLYIDNTEGQMRRLIEGIEDLGVEQMTWTPPGVKNSLSWLLRHWADLIWFNFGVLSDTTLPIRPDVQGIPEAFLLKNITFDDKALEPGLSGRERIDYLEKAWANLKGYLLENYPDCMTATVSTSKGDRLSAWWLLEHMLVDMSYHGGQANYLKRLLPP